MNKKQLFDGGDSESEEETTLKTNKAFAKSFNTLREKELYKKIKDQDLNNPESGSDSESSSSEEDEINDAKFDEEFFKTLSSLKSKDPKIYDKASTFFSEDDGSSESGNESSKDTKKRNKNKKPMTLNDYERKVILEKGGKYVDDIDEDDNTGDYPNEDYSNNGPSYVEEQDELRNEFRKAINNDDSSEEEEFGGIFKKRNKSKEEKVKEEIEFTQWLAGNNADEDLKDENVKQTLAPLKEYWNKPNLNSREKFLRDYILTKGYSNADHDDIPTYEEIIGEDEEDKNLSADEEELEKQAEFEQKFNFRFEDPDQEFIKRYPRTIDNSVRKTDDKRKQKRQETKDRKDREKQDKMHELKIVKEIKKKEIQEKIEKLKMVTGNEDLPFNSDELDDDFDPEEHDRRMQEIYNDEYYQIDEGEDKPECPDIDELKFEDWDNYNPGNSHDNDPHCEDDDFNMDCEFDPIAAAEAKKKETQDELIQSTKRRRGRKNRFMEMIKAEKPAFNPEDEKNYGDYIDEYYKMDCEDIIGDLPCRFKYVECEPNDFGLSIEEILLAKNKELNQWASLKKAVQIRPQHLEKKEQRLYKLKAKNEDLKRKIFRSLYDPSSDEEEEKEDKRQAGTSTEDPAKKKKKKKNKKRKTSNTEGGVEIKTVESNEGKVAKKVKLEIVQSNEQTTKPKINSQDVRKNKPFESKQNGKNNPFGNSKKQSYNQNDQKFGNNKKNPFNKNADKNGISDERLKAYGINPRKFHNKQKFGNKTK